MPEQAATTNFSLIDLDPSAGRNRADLIALAMTKCMSDESRQLLALRLDTYYAERMGINPDADTVAADTVANEPATEAVVVSLDSGRRHRAAGVVLAVSAGLLVSACAGAGGDQKSDSTTIEATEGTTSPATAGEKAACFEKWIMNEMPVNERNRFYADGVSEIGDAVRAGDEESARSAQAAWLYGTSERQGVIYEPRFFAYGYNATMRAVKGAGNFTELTPADLVDEEGCATEIAINAVVEMELEMAMAELQAVDTIDDQAGYNSGLGENGVGKSAHAGISGNMNSLQFTFTRADGAQCKLWVLDRCGQLYTQEECTPDAPDTPTDEVFDEKIPVPLDPTMPHSQPGSLNGPEAGVTDPKADSPETGYSDPGDLPKDTDGDGIVDIVDACPVAPETYNQHKDTDGCPDKPPVTPGNPIPTEPPIPVPTTTSTSVPAGPPPTYVP